MKIQQSRAEKIILPSVILREVAESSRAELRGFDAVREEAKKENGREKGKKEENKSEELAPATYAQDDKRAENNRMSRKYCPQNLYAFARAKVLF